MKDNVTKPKRARSKQDARRKEVLWQYEEEVLAYWKAKVRYWRTLQDDLNLSVDPAALEDLLEIATRWRSGHKPKHSNLIL